jgi:hypothetical protein
MSAHIETIRVDGFNQAVKDEVFIVRANDTAVTRSLVLAVERKTTDQRLEISIVYGLADQPLIRRYFKSYNIIGGIRPSRSIAMMTIEEKDEPNPKV